MKLIKVLKLLAALIELLDGVDEGEIEKIIELFNNLIGKKNGTI